MRTYLILLRTIPYPMVPPIVLSWTYLNVSKSKHKAVRLAMFLRTRPTYLVNPWKDQISWYDTFRVIGQIGVKNAECSYIKWFFSLILRYFKNDWWFIAVRIGQVKRDKSVWNKYNRLEKYCLKIRVRVINVFIYG